MNGWGGSHGASGTGRGLIYYFGFPHYRRAILETVTANHDSTGTVDVVSGSGSRDGIEVLTASDWSGLEQLRTIRVGIATWDRGIVLRASSSTYTTVVLGPAVASLSTWAILLLRALARRRTLLWGVCGKPGDRSIKRLLQEVMNRLATGLLVYGSLEEAGALELGLDSTKVRRVHNATAAVAEVDSNETVFLRLREAIARTQSGQLHLVYAGRVNRDKYLDVLLVAARKLRTDFPGLEITLIGTGTELKRLRSDFPDDYIHFVGPIYESAELEDALSRATFVVSPSTLGLLALDALRAGSLVLVPNHPRNGSEVEALTVGVNATVFQHEDADEIVDAVYRGIAMGGGLDFNDFAAARSTGLDEWSPAYVAERLRDAMMLSPEDDTTPRQPTSD